MKKIASISKPTAKGWVCISFGLIKLEDGVFSKPESVWVKADDECLKEMKVGDMMA